jgi:TRAP-type C4-dicarboxylate transport system permease small subunit
MSLIKKFELAPVALACLTLFLLMGMTFFDVVLRSVANAPIAAGPELTRIMMAIVVFSVLPIVSLHGQHISVDLIDPWLSARVRRVRGIILAAVSGVLLLWPALQVARLAERARDYGDVTEYLALPTFYVTWFIAIATFLTAGTLLLRAVLLVIAPRSLEDVE